MTIYLYSGTPGSGKSLHATRIIKDSLDYKKPVIANYDLVPRKNKDYFTYRPNAEMTPDFLVEYATEYWQDHRFKEDHILLVLDECQLLFNSREWQNDSRMKWLEFFSQHRKYGYEIVFVAQFDRMIDRQIRSLLEYEFVHRRMGNFGWKGKMFKLLTLGELFVCVKRFYPLREKVGVECFKARRSIFRMYDSYGAFARKAQGD
ncbi:MAG: zonular occludens toxin domain-containing protein [Gordonibacter sp.]|uniref:zonular occludens toxin domain-containing protein n=1 Tax=Gordonibacter sp. TaxID=1968902 RepID=UPI002FCA42B3